MCVFKRLLFGGAKNDEGYIVKFRIGARYIEYREKDYACKIMAEPLAGVPSVAIPGPEMFSKMNLSWEMPFANEPISNEKRKQILRRVIDALNFSRITHELLHK